MLARVKMLNPVVVILLVLVLMPGASAARTGIGGTATDSADDPPNPVHPPFSPADSENVELVGHIGGVTRAVAVQGNYAYIGEGPRLTVLDISNPALPTVVGKTPLLPDIVRGVAVVREYVAGGLSAFGVEKLAVRSVEEFAEFVLWGLRFEGRVALVRRARGFTNPSPGCKPLTLKPIE